MNAPRTVDLDDAGPDIYDLIADNQRLREAAEWLIADYEAKVAAGSTSAQNFSHAVSLARAALKGAK